MPPKKGQPAKGALAKTTIKSDFLASVLQSNLDASSGAASLSSEQLSRAYGLAPAPEGSAAAPVLLRQCPPKWNEDQSAEGSKRSSPAVQVLVLDSSDDEEPTKPLKNVTRGKKDDQACSSEHCSNNPRCLNWLGQDKWENTKTALKSFAKKAGLGSNPANERTEVPVGLRNLGATCYANSFLQCWFRDVPFRNGVYGCLPPENGNVEASPLFQLQVLFAFLQSSKQAVYDPEPLVRALKLDSSEQQDAQEFSKLFMSLLDHEFKKQAKKLRAEGGDPAVAKLVSNQFEGTTTYGTQCSSCKSKSERQETFFELSFNLTANCKLEKRIEASLEKEILSGDNQYYCDQCGGMSDAVRTTRLETLPPVLHFSLLRFVFNMKELTRTKSQMSISYPLKLDMGKYLPKDAHGRHQQVWYDLKGVLMHKGKSAHHGHYVAQVHDDAQSKWFLFDDESVTPIDDLNGPDLYDEDGERVVPSKKKTKSKAAAVERDADGAVIPKSKDAYMLIYTKRADPTAPQPAPVDPPPLAAAKVDELDEKREKDVNEYTLQAEHVKADFEKAREAKRSVYRNWDVMNDDEDSFLVSKSELKRWVSEGLAVDKKAKSDSPSASDKGKEKEVKAEVAPASPASISPEIDAAYKIAQASLPDAVPVAGPSSSRKPPSKSKPDVIVYDEEEFERQMQEQLNAEKRARGSPLPGEGDTSPSSPTLNGHAGPKVDDSGIDMQLDDKILNNVEVLCRHEKMDPRKAEQVKRVSQLAVMSLRELGVKIEPEIMVPRDFCRECAWTIAAQSFYNRNHPEQVREFNKLNKDGSEDNLVLISKAWLLDWNKASPRMHIAEECRDPAPDEGLFEHDVICPHGNLNPSSKVIDYISPEPAQLLSSIFPTWTVIHDESKPKECRDCKKKQEKEKQEAEELGGILKAEKPVFKNFADLMQGTLTRGFVIPGDYGFLIPRSFVKEWINWSRKSTTVSRPSMVQNDRFMCKHGRVSIDLEKEANSPDELAVVSEKQWKLLTENYAAAPPIKIFGQRGGLYHTSPQVCEECLDIKRKDFSSTKLGIKMLTDDDFDGKDRKFQASSSPEVMIMAAPNGKSTASKFHNAAKTYGSHGSRSSARIAAKPEMQFRKELKYIEMNKGDTVKDLRMKIADRLNIPTICQRLFYQMQELESDQTVEEIGLLADATLELYEVQQDDVDFAKLDDTVDDATVKKGKGKGKRTRDEGFGGTGLYGWESQETGPKDDSMEVDDSAGAADDEGNNNANGKDPEEDSPSGNKRPRRSTAGKASANGSTGASAKSSSGGKKVGKAKKSANDDVDDMEVDDGEQLKCPACTFLNSADAESCSICETALDVPPEAMS